MPYADDIDAIKQLYRDKKYAEAIAGCLRILNTHGLTDAKKAKAHWVLGKAYYKLGMSTPDFSEARPHYENSIRNHRITFMLLVSNDDDKNRMSCLYRLTDSYSAIGNYPKALEQHDSLINAAKKKGHNTIDLEARRGRTLMRAGDHRNALTRLKEIVLPNPAAYYYGIHYRISHLEASLGVSDETLKKHLRELHMAPKDAPKLYSYGHYVAAILSLKTNEDPDIALQHLAECFADHHLHHNHNHNHNHITEFHYYRGLAHLKKGDKTQALADFNTMIAINPSHWQSYCAKGWLNMMSDDEREAVFNAAVHQATDTFHGCVEQQAPSSDIPVEEAILMSIPHFSPEKKQLLRDQRALALINRGAFYLQHSMANKAEADFNTVFEDEEVCAPYRLYAASQLFKRGNSIHTDLMDQLIQQVEALEEKSSEVVCILYTALLACRGEISCNTELNPFEQMNIPAYLMAEINALKEGVNRLSLDFYEPKPPHELVC